MMQIVTCWLEHPGLIPAYEAAVRGARVIIVDQASSPPVAEALDAMAARLGHGSLVVRSAENLRFAAGNNVGLGVAAGEGDAGAAIVCLNNDVQGPANPANRWLAMVERDVAAGALYGPAALGFEVDGEAYPYIEGWCVAATRATWAMVGGWDAVTYPEAYAEDVDLSWRARLAGCRLLQTPRWPIQHLSNRTNATLPGAYDHADAQRERFRGRVRAWRRGELVIGAAA